ncbi:HPP family protein [Desulfocurvibacter africanus]|uniref:HPP family protein n=1 Tax=Desulfocurvibacter africanus TaxID=873 RepID=UPI000400C505|nr:HPP family protein [Desulfocurvibacter africanus]
MNNKDIPTATLDSRSLRPEECEGNSCRESVLRYLTKMRGKSVAPPCPCLREVCWSWLGAFLGILAVSFLSHKMMDGTGPLMLVGSFGASAVLIYGAVESPLAQPRNLLGGHVLSALIGVAVAKLLPEAVWIAAPLAVATSIAAMHVTRTLHPPGGATALIAVIGGEPVRALGFMYALAPVGLGALIMLAVALAVNNLSPRRCYPVFWR